MALTQLTDLQPTNIKVTGIATFDQTVGIAGTLTYQDVTNIDSIGIVTAREGIKIPDDKYIKIGSSDDLQIYHAAGAASHINNTGLLNIDGTTGVRLEYNNANRVYCTSTGVTLGGDIEIADKIVHEGDTNTTIRFPANDTITAETGGSERLRIDSNGDLGINVTNPTEKLHVSGNIKLTGQFYQSVPADNWSQSNTFIELNGMGNLTHQGSYETCLTSNGYRNTSSQWTSYAINSYTGASQIRLNPQGHIIFGTESNKANGSTHVVTERLRIKSDGFIQLSSATVNTIHTSSDASKIAIFAGSTNSVSNGGVITVTGVNHSAGCFTDVSAGTGGHTQFRIGTSEKMRITAGGEVLVGVTSTGTDPTKNITMHAGSMMRVSNFYMGAIHGSANNGNAAIVLHRLGQNQGFQMSGSMTFHSYTGSAYLSGCIVARYNTDAVTRDISLQKAQSGFDLQLVTGTISGVSGDYLAIKKNGGGTGVCYINGFFGGNIEAYGGIREIASSDWTTTTVHGSGITGSNDSASS